MAADESSAPRHGRHAAAGRHAAPRHQPAPTPEPSFDAVSDVPVQPSVPAEAPQAAPVEATVVAPAPATRVQSIPETIPDIVPIVDGDQETRMGDAPRPIDVDPQETGSFQRIDASQGARVTTRANAGETNPHMEGARRIEAVRMSSGRPKVERHETAVESNARVFLALGIAALVVVAIVGRLLVSALVSVEETPEEQVMEQAQVTGDDGIEYRGTTYALRQKGEAYALVSTAEGQDEEAVLCELKGTPVTLVLYNTVFVIPENLPDGTWDLIAYPLGAGAVTQQVTDSEGKPIVEPGQISEATLVGDGIQVVTDAGDTMVVSLV